MVRLLILGASGTGCTTLGNSLAKVLCIPHFDGDEYYWVKTDPPYTEKRTLSEKQTLLKKDLSSHDGWIFSGSPASWAPFVFPMLTATVFLYSEWQVRSERIKQREASRFGNRILPGGDMYENHNNFLDWAKGYDENDTSSRTLVRHHELLKSLHCPVIKIEGDISVDDTMRRVEKFLESIH